MQWVPHRAQLQHEFAGFPSALKDAEAGLAERWALISKNTRHRLRAEIQAAADDENELQRLAKVLLQAKAAGPRPRPPPRPPFTPPASASTTPTW